MATKKEQVAFELENPGGHVTNASEIGYGDGDVKEELDKVNREFSELNGGTVVVSTNITSQFSNTYSTSQNSKLRGIIRGVGTMVGTIAATTDEDTTLYFYYPSNNVKKLKLQNLANGSSVNARCCYCCYNAVKSYDQITTEEVLSDYKDPSPATNKEIASLELTITSSIKMVVLAGRTSDGDIVIVEETEETTGGTINELEQVIEDLGQQISDLEDEVENAFGLTTNITLPTAQSGHFYAYGRLETGTAVYYEPVDISAYIGKHIKLSLDYGSQTGLQTSARCIYLCTGSSSSNLGTIKQEWVEKDLVEAAVDGKIEIDITVDASYIAISYRNAETGISLTHREKGTLDILSGKVDELEDKTDGYDAQFENIEEEIEGIIGTQELTPIAMPTSSSGGYYDEHILKSGTGIYYEPVDISAYIGQSIKMIIDYGADTSAIINSSRKIYLCTGSSSSNLGTFKQEWAEKDLVAASSGGKITVNINVDAPYIAVSYRNSSTQFSLAVLTEVKGVIDQKIDARGISSHVWYVATTGSDSNEGNKTTPLKTLGKALEKASPNDNIMVLSGDYTGEVIDLADYGNKVVNIVGQGNVRFIYGTKIVEDGDEVADNTYTNVKKVTTDASLGSSYNLIQHDVNDPATAIPVADKHILHGAKTYRCGSTIIRPIRMYYRTGRGAVSSFTEAEALTAMNSEVANNKYYWYKSGSTLYFTSPSATTSNPIIYPTPSEYGFTCNHDTAFRLCNIQFMYAGIDIAQSNNSEVTGCKVLYANVGAGIKYGAAQYLTLRQCEVAGIKDGDDLGDGFNGHGENTRRTIIKLEDCWSHDNNDDGQSEHGNVDIIDINCLFEYNVKAGFTPVMTNSNYELYKCISRYNTDVDANCGGGFLQAGVDNISTIKLVDCEAYGNSGWGFKLGNNCTHIRCKSSNAFVSGINTKYVECVASNASFGFDVYSAGSATLIDCACINCTSKTHGSGAITVVNSEKVTAS